MIEVMWLILAVLGSWVYAAKLGVLIHHLIKQESLQNKPPFTNKIRPPPIFIRGKLKSLKLNIKHSNYEPIGPKHNA